MNKNIFFKEKENYNETPGFMTQKKLFLPTICLFYFILFIYFERERGWGKSSVSKKVKSKKMSVP